MLSLSQADASSDSACIAFVTEFRAHSRALIDMQVGPGRSIVCDEVDSWIKRVVGEDAWRHEQEWVQRWLG
jgi:hypothetical protein